MDEYARPPIVISGDEKQDAIGKLRQKHPGRAEEISAFAETATPEGWEELVVHEPEHFSSKTLMRLAAVEGEYAPSLIKHLARRGDHLQTLAVLWAHRDDGQFKHLCTEIEKVADVATLRAYAEVFERMDRQPRKIAGHEKSFMEGVEKQCITNDRPLEEYLRVLDLDDDRLRALDGRKLLLLGGGRSPIKDMLNSRGIHADVINIDPLADPDPAVADTHRKEDFLDAAKSLPPHGVNEIWAVESMPAYAFNEKQVIGVYTEALKALSQHGHLRIYPVSGFRYAPHPPMLINRTPVNDMSKEIIRELEASPLFKVHRYEKEKVGVFSRQMTPGVDVEIVGPLEKVDTFLNDLAHRKEASIQLNPEINISRMAQLLKSGIDSPSPD